MPSNQNKTDVPQKSYEPNCTLPFMPHHEIKKAVTVKTLSRLIRLTNQYREEPLQRQAFGHVIQRVTAAEHLPPIPLSKEPIQSFPLAVVGRIIIRSNGIVM